MKPLTSKQEQLINEQFLEAFDLVGQFFADQNLHYKTILWFTASNPHLGDVNPMLMLLSGRGKKLLKFIKSSIAENK